MKKFFIFFFKYSILFTIFSFSFSIIGGLFPSSEFSEVLGNPLLTSGISFEHVLGHITWGSFATLTTFSIRHIILGGAFTILLDADHLLQFLNIELISRMSHSIPFGLIAAGLFFIILKGKDIRLVTISIGAVISHMSFDIFLANVVYNDNTTFPLFSPFLLERFSFGGFDWVWFELIAILIVLGGYFLQKLNLISKENNQFS